MNGLQVEPANSPDRGGSEPDFVVRAQLDTLALIHKCDLHAVQSRLRIDTRLQADRSAHPIHPVKHGLSHHRCGFQKNTHGLLANSMTVIRSPFAMANRDLSGSKAMGGGIASPSARAEMLLS